MTLLRRRARMLACTSAVVEHVAGPPEPGSSGGPGLRLRLLGGFELTVGGVPWELPPAAARLVAFLALQDVVVDAREAAGAAHAQLVGGTASPRTSCPASCSRAGTTTG